MRTVVLPPHAVPGVRERVHQQILKPLRDRGEGGRVRARGNGGGRCRVVARGGVCGSVRLCKEDSLQRLGLHGHRRNRTFPVGRRQVSPRANQATSRVEVGVFVSKRGERLVRGVVVVVPVLEVPAHGNDEGGV